MDLKKLMQQAQDMQKKMQTAQEEITKLEVVGESGGGAVSFVFNGQHKAKSCKISPDITPGLSDADREVLEDLLVAGINDGHGKIEDKSKQKLSQLTAGLELPEGFKG